MTEFKALANSVIEALCLIDKLMEKSDKLTEKVDSLTSMVADMPTGKRMMNSKDFCRAYDVSSTDFYRKVNTPGFPAYKTGGTWTVDCAAYEQWCKVQHANNCA